MTMNMGFAYENSSESSHYLDNLSTISSVSMSNYIQDGLEHFIKNDLAARHEENEIKILLEIINLDYKAPRPETRSMKLRRKLMEEVAVKMLDKLSVQEIKAELGKRGLPTNGMKNMLAYRLGDFLESLGINSDFKKFHINPKRLDDLNLQEIRMELKARNLSTSGVKAICKERLISFLDNEGFDARKFIFLLHPNDNPRYLPEAIASNDSSSIDIATNSGQSDVVFLKEVIRHHDISDEEGSIEDRRTPSPLFYRRTPVPSEDEFEERIISSSPPQYLPKPHGPSKLKATDDEVRHAPSTTSTASTTPNGISAEETVTAAECEEELRRRINICIRKEFHSNMESFLKDVKTLIEENNHLAEKIKNYHK